MSAPGDLVVYVDVDDTLVRSAGTKRLPMPEVVAHVRILAGAGAQLYCWSTGGSEYARSTARELGIEACFSGFLPKPNVLIDDQEVAAWRRFATVHPLSVSGRTIEAYLTVLDRDHSKPK